VWHGTSTGSLSPARLGRSELIAADLVEPSEIVADSRSHDLSGDAFVVVAQRRETSRLPQRRESYCTPKHAICLNMVEFEIVALRVRWLTRRIGEHRPLIAEIDAWKRHRNASGP